jgi:DNA-binding SARP family transcriptional activator
MIRVILAMLLLPALTDLRNDQQSTTQPTTQQLAAMDRNATAASRICAVYMTHLQALIVRPIGDGLSYSQFTDSLLQLHGEVLWIKESDEWKDPETRRYIEPRVAVLEQLMSAHEAWSTERHFESLATTEPEMREQYLEAARQSHIAREARLRNARNDFEQVKQGARLQGK